MTAPARPAAATAAAVITIVQAGLLGVPVVLALLGVPLADDGRSPGVGQALALGLLLAFATWLVLGGTALLRGWGRGIVVAVAWVDVVGVCLVTLAGVVLSSAVSGALAGVLLVLGLCYLALPVVRLVLAGRPSVTAYLQACRRARGDLPARFPRRLLAVAAAGCAALTLVGVVVAATAVPASTGYGGGYASGYDTAYDTGYDSADLDGEGRYRGSVPEYWDAYDGGDPVVPPTLGSPDYLAEYTQLAVGCWRDDMPACDSLYATTPVGSYYEWLGATCGGRLEYWAPGSCTTEVG